MTRREWALLALAVVLTAPGCVSWALLLAWLSGNPMPWDAR